MTLSKLTSDKVCSHCGMARFKPYPTSLSLTLKCHGCGAVKCRGAKEDEIHNRLHFEGEGILGTTGAIYKS